MDFIDDVRVRSTRFAKRVEHLLTEEATKSALVLPFIQMLGYDIFDPLEVVPEFTADMGFKKGEKVDYAIIQDGMPIILLEAKKYGKNLEEADISQLLRYFAGTTARFGILTDGVVYRFFSDLEDSNKMDVHPFFEFNMLDFSDAQVAELKRFSKGSFNLGEVRVAARDLKYLADIKRILAAELASPSQEFIGFLRKRAFERPPSSRVKEQFEPRVKQAFGQFIKDHIKERFQSALAQEEVPATVVPDTPVVKVQRQSPKALVERWATEHGGEIVLDDFVTAVVGDGTYPDRRRAYNAVYVVVKRDHRMVKVAPGRYAITEEEVSGVEVLDIHTIL